MPYNSSHFYKSPLAKKPEPYSSSFKETLRQADGSDKEYLETSSNVRDREKPGPTAEMRFVER